MKIKNINNLLKLITIFIIIFSFYITLAPIHLKTENPSLPQTEKRSLQNPSLPLKKAKMRSQEMAPIFEEKTMKLENLEYNLDINDINDKMNQMASEIDGVNNKLDKLLYSILGTLTGLLTTFLTIFLTPFIQKFSSDIINEDKVKK